MLAKRNSSPFFLFTSISRRCEKVWFTEEEEEEEEGQGKCVGASVYLCESYVRCSGSHLIHRCSV